MEPLVDNSQTKREKFVDYVKEFKESHKILFWVILVIVIVAFIAIIAVIVYMVNKNKNKPKENYASSDDISSEFDYVNSYIYSTLGEDIKEDNLV